jgi:hypothetical protein
MSEPQPTSADAFNRRAFVRSIVLNAAVPLALYSLAKSYLAASEFEALAIAALFPILGSIVGIARARHLDLIAILALLGIAISMFGIALGGDPKILLIRESFLTAGLGIACFISLLLPRPLMFYFGRQLATGGDPTRIAEFEAQYQIPAARRVHRLITIVWGVVFTSEFVLRVIMVYSLPIPVVIVVSPIIFGAVVLGTITWTFAYVRRVRERAARARAATLQTDEMPG